MTTPTGYMHSTVYVRVNCANVAITMILLYLMVMPGLNGLKCTAKEEEVGKMATVPGFLAYKTL